MTAKKLHAGADFGRTQMCAGQDIQSQWEHIDGIGLGNRSSDHGACGGMPWPRIGQRNAEFLQQGMLRGTAAITGQQQVNIFPIGTLFEQVLQCIAMAERLGSIVRIVGRGLFQPDACFDTLRETVAAPFDFLGFITHGQNARRPVRYSALPAKG